MCGGIRLQTRLPRYIVATISIGKKRRTHNSPANLDLDTLAMIA